MHRVIVLSQNYLKTDLHCLGHGLVVRELGLTLILVFKVGLFSLILRLDVVVL